MLFRCFNERRSIQLAGLLTLAVLSGCSNTRVASSTRPATRPANQVLVDPCASFDYTGWYNVMPAEQRAKLAVDVAWLQLGDSRKTVLEFMGVPQREADGQAKYYLPFGRKHRCWYLLYSVARVSDGANVKDQDVSFWFDCHDRLEIIDSNVPGIPTREAPDAMSNKWRFCP